MLPNFVLYEIDPCPDCGMNQWQYDGELDMKTKGRLNRFSCWPCGTDFYVGGMNPVMLRELRNRELRKESSQKVSQKANEAQ